MADELRPDTARAAVPRQDQRRRLNELLDEYQRHPGWSIRLRWMQLIRTHGVFAGNRDELAAWIDGARDQTMALELVQNVRRRDLQTAYYSELDRRFHNYLAGAVSLRDHVASFVKRHYEGTQLGVIHKTRRKELDDNALWLFFLRLRHMFLKDEFGGLAAVTRMSITSGATSGSIVVNVDELRAWRNPHGHSPWTKRERAFLDQFAEPPRLSGLFYEHACDIEIFWGRIFDWRDLLHGAEIKTHREIEHELNQSRFELSPNAPPPPAETSYETHKPDRRED